MNKLYLSDSMINDEISRASIRLLNESRIQYRSLDFSKQAKEIDTLTNGCAFDEVEETQSSNEICVKLEELFDTEEMWRGVSGSTASINRHSRKISNRLEKAQNEINFIGVLGGFAYHSYENVLGQKRNGVLAVIMNSSHALLRQFSDSQDYFTHQHDSTRFVPLLEAHELTVID